MATEKFIAELRSNAIAFHDAIKMTDFSFTGLNLQHFPKECCHYGCTHLGAFLFEQGFKQIQKMKGERPDKERASDCHLWLEVSGVTVDITAYQFEDIEEKVIVTSQSPWHSEKKGTPVPFNNNDEPLDKFFRRISNEMNERHEGLYDHLSQLALFFLSD